MLHWKGCLVCAPAVLDSILVQGASKQLHRGVSHMVYIYLPMSCALMRTISTSSPPIAAYQEFQSPVMSTELLLATGPSHLNTAVVCTSLQVRGMLPGMLSSCFTTKTHSLGTAAWLLLASYLSVPTTWEWEQNMQHRYLTPVVVVVPCAIGDGLFARAGHPGIINCMGKIGSVNWGAPRETVFHKGRQDASPSWVPHQGCTPQGDGDN